MMGTPFMGVGISAALLLIALAAGYIVCSIAKKEQGAIRTVGYVIGIAVIAIAALLIFNGLAWKARLHQKMRCTGMGMQGGGGMMMKDMPMPAPKK